MSDSASRERVSVELTGREVITALLEYHFKDRGPMSFTDSGMSFDTRGKSNLEADDFKVTLWWKQQR